MVIAAGKQSTGSSLTIMVRCFYLPSDLQALLNSMDDIDSDDSDEGGFEWYVDSDDEEYVAWRQERRERMEEVSRTDNDSEMGWTGTELEETSPGCTDRQREWQ